MNDDRPDPHHDLHHDLDDLLHDAVADVHPRGGPDDVRARAQRHHGVRGWLPITVAAAVATVLVIGGTAWLGGRDDGPTAVGPSRPDASELPTASDGPRRHRAGRGVLRRRTAQGRRLFQEQRVVPTTGRTKVQAAVEQALTQAPHDPDYDPWAKVSGLRVTTEVQADEITIDITGLQDTGASVSGRDAETYLQALVWTADTATASDLPVRFLADGRQVDEILGVDTSEPVARESAESVLSPVSITTPAQGAILPTTFDVTGQASAYEGNVVWELKRGSTVVRSGHTTTGEAFVQSPYAFRVTAPRGEYTLVVHDTDESDGEGVGVTQDTRDVSLRTRF